ncbi:hypothetical protein PBY51_018250 [Eleginops maclovinus]|uniref:Uncharacterized protein n=1 Tax=Eleginops maclovinus TaxID=56733 RepID=A0AAN7XNB8_ELEMC|nr:hypothetical protein PBY51_018250 [Eleginops maclovinus]
MFFPGSAQVRDEWCLAESLPGQLKLTAAADASERAAIALVTPPLNRHNLNSCAFIWAAPKAAHLLSQKEASW